MNGRQSVESESRLKIHILANSGWERAPVIVEPTRQPPKPGFPRRKVDKEAEHKQQMLEILREFRNQEENGTARRKEEEPVF